MGAVFRALVRAPVRAPLPAVPDRPRSRRDVLVLGASLGTGSVLAAAGLTGCSVNNPFDDEETPAARAVPDLAPDVAVAVEAVTAIRSTEQLLDAVAGRHPRLRASLQGLSAMHRAHLAALVDAVPERVDTSATEQPPPVAPTAPAARGQLLDREHRLHQQLTGLALRAESGAFARLLGSAAASVSQHLAVLP